MPILRRDDFLSTPQGQALAGAEVYYLTQPADTTDFPPSPLALVYSDLAGTPAANPQLTDGFGHAVAYLANTQLYTIAFYHPLLGDGPLVLEDQSITGGSGSSAATPFGQRPTGDVDGANTVFTLPFTPSLLILQNGLGLLLPGLGYNTSIVSGVFTMTLAVAPVSPEVVYASGIR